MLSAQAPIQKRKLPTLFRAISDDPEPTPNPYSHVLSLDSNEIVARPNCRSDLIIERLHITLPNGKRQRLQAILPRPITFKWNRVQKGIGLNIDYVKCVAQLRRHLKPRLPQYVHFLYPQDRLSLGISHVQRLCSLAYRDHFSPHARQAHFHSGRPTKEISIRQCSWLPKVGTVSLFDLRTFGFFLARFRGIGRVFEPSIGDVLFKKNMPSTSLSIILADVQSLYRVLFIPDDTTEQRAFLRPRQASETIRELHADLVFVQGTVNIERTHNTITKRFIVEGSAPDYIIQYNRDKIRVQTPVIWLEGNWSEDFYAIDASCDLSKLQVEDDAICFQLQGNSVRYARLEEKDIEPRSSYAVHWTPIAEDKAVLLDAPDDRIVGNLFLELPFIALYGWDNWYVRNGFEARRYPLRKRRN